MATIQIESTSPPLDEPATAAAAFRLVHTAEAMGVYEPTRTVRALDLAVLRDVVRAVRRAGVGRDPRWAFEDDLEAAELRERIDQLTAALEGSPSPATEWRRLSRLLGPDLLSTLVGVSESSLGRYLAGERTTPDDVADRLHALALIVGDLAGAYNEIGVRRWFERRRSALDGRRPADALSGTWSPEDEAPRRVRALAHALVGSPAT